MSLHAKLRTPGESLPTWPAIDSSRLVVTDVDDSVPAERIRDHFLTSFRWADLPPVIIACSPFVPGHYFDRFFRDKRDSAIATKYVRGSAITNHEGMLHTFVCALTPILMFGDYCFNDRHSVAEFPNIGGKRQARQCVLSTVIHPDFEDGQIAMSALSLEERTVKSHAYLDDETPPTSTEKEDDSCRLEWDAKVKRHLVFSLSTSRSLSSSSTASENHISIAEAVNRLTRSACQCDVAETIISTPSGALVSLDMLGNTYVASLVNELSVLEYQCSEGYVYTYDPPSIFARALGPHGATMLNRLMIRALSVILSHNTISRLRAFVFNDYADQEALPLLERVLAGTSIRAYRRAEVFDPSTGYYRGEELFPGLTIVIHNNSDAFGQNIETEGCTSLDGAIGVYSNAAAALRRDRPDLTSHVM